MPWLESPFIAAQSIKGNVTLVIMRPLGVHFALTILDTPKTSNIASIDHYHVAFTAEADFQEGVTSSTRTN